jgi:hypothetical protein
MKMKKIVCILVLACVIMGAAFAQQKPATPAEAPKELKNAVGVDLFQLLKGFIITDNDNDFSVFIISGGYERLVAPHFSFGVDFDLYVYKFDSVDGNYLSVAAEGRYYPQSANFEKFFLGTTLGFNQLAIDGKTKPEEGGFSGLIVSLKAGYKLIVKDNMYLEPSFAYVLSKSSMTDFFGISMGTPLGWHGGLRLGLLF